MDCVVAIDEVAYLHTENVSEDAARQCNKWAHIKVWCALFDSAAAMSISTGQI